MIVNKSGYVCVDEKTDLPIEIDVTSGGYPVVTKEPGRVYIFPDKAGAERYAKMFQSDSGHVKLYVVYGSVTTEYKRVEI